MNHYGFDSQRKLHDTAADALEVAQKGIERLTESEKWLERRSSLLENSLELFSRQLKIDRPRRESGIGTIRIAHTESGGAAQNRYASRDWSCSIRTRMHSLEMPALWDVSDP